MGTVTCSCGGFSLVQHGELTASPLSSLGRKAGCSLCPRHWRARVPALREQQPPPHPWYPNSWPFTFHRLPTPITFPVCSPAPLSLGRAACGAAEQQEQMRHGP